MSNISKYNINLDNINYDYKDKKTNINNYVRYMLNKTNIMFHYENMPDSLPASQLEMMLQSNGFVAVAKVDDNIYAFNCGFSGNKDVYYNPISVLINNPNINYNEELVIDKECVLFKNDSMLMGLVPIYTKYASLIIENDISCVMANINKRIQTLLSANDDNTIESAKLFLTDIENGKLSVVADSKLFDSLKVNPTTTSNNNNLHDLIEYNQYVKAELYNEVGLPMNNQMKKEHLIKAEIEDNSDFLYPLVDNMLYERRIAVDKINKMFDTDITVEFNSVWEHRVFNGESITTKGDVTEPIEEQANIDTTVDNIQQNDSDVDDTQQNDSDVDDTQQNDSDVNDTQQNDSDKDDKDDDTDTQN